MNILRMYDRFARIVDPTRMSGRRLDLFVAVKTVVVLLVLLVVWAIEDMNSVVVYQDF
jgi:hypothetical protein